jgi:hypothetical protein
MGTVGIGANTPTQKLDISGGNIQLGNTYGIYSRLTGGASVNILSYNSSNLTRVGANGEIELGGYVAFKPTGAERMRITSDGKVGIGTTSPSYSLDIQGRNFFLGDSETGAGSRIDNSIKWGHIIAPHYINAEEPVNLIGSYSDSTSNNIFIGGGLTASYNATSKISFFTAANPTTTIGTQRMLIDQNGNVGIGTTTPVTLLTVGPSSSTTAPNGLCFGNESSSNLYRSATSTIKTDSNLIVAQNLTVTNHLSAATKSFLIDHPIKIGKKLQYGVLEGPEHSVYIRGKMSNSNFINFPDYWNYLVDLNSITVSITPIGNSQNLFVQEINCSGVIVAGEALEKMNYYYHVFGERKDVPKIQIEI